MENVIGTVAPIFAGRENSLPAKRDPIIKRAKNVKYVSFSFTNRGASKSVRPRARWLESPLNIPDDAPLERQIYDKI